MKKFYFFLVACFLMGVGAISAADKYQLHSSITGNSSWESVDLTPNGDWYEYTGTFVAGEFGIKKNGGWYGGGGANITKADTDYSFNPSSGNSKSTLKGNFTFGFNPTTNQVRMVTYSGTITEVVTYAVRGTINGAGDWTDEEMTKGTDGIYSLTKDFVAGTFGVKKMVNGSEKGWYGYSALGTPKDNCTENTANKNIDLKPGGNYTIAIDPAKGEVTVKFNGGEIPTPDATVYLAGEFNEYNATDANTKFTKGNDGIYTLELASLTGNFKVVCDGAWLGTTTPVESGVEYALADIGFDNMALAAPAATNLKFRFNPDGNKLVVTYDGGVVSAPETLYVLGDFPGDETTHWNPTYGVKLTKDGEKFTGNITIETAMDNDYGFFSLCTQLSSSSDDWSVGTRYGAKEADIVVEANEYYDFVKGDTAWSVLPGIYEITVDFSDSTIMLTKKSDGIDGAFVDANDAAPVYYNLQGVRVAEPTNGLYIVVRGDKVVKELVK